ncbi:helix-turn-helix domain-containing protein [Fulvivirga ligni]|uniref:helix-turn-helix domain-containing protein n=1 Tax=Fulvivirga ligni TaxID=2904246 RepID=UPI001F360E42|nr:helix-turn-helix transcriptional regulator [Fulvivirga ligni]UII19577.1 helix-turn-helix transcriptional regulator [Fulvivirga ligni]
MDYVIYATLCWLGFTFKGIYGLSILLGVLFTPLIFYRFTLFIKGLLRSLGRKNRKEDLHKNRETIHFLKVNQIMLESSHNESVTSSERKLAFFKMVNENIEQGILDGKLSVAELASKMNMNRSQLYRKIKAHTGESATQYIRNVRLNRSLDYLNDDTYHISEVAYMVGFDSPWYFSKCFKEKYGLSPSHYQTLSAKGKHELIFK